LTIYRYFMQSLFIRFWVEERAI